jgi:RNA polymerase nonessential primary-like sigma factor
VQVRPSQIRQTLRALSKAPERLLSHDEMVLLHRAWSQGIMADECLEAMIWHNFGFVRDVCKVIKHKEHFTDACQYCIEGLIRAIEKWEPERGLRFSTYAHPWIYQKLRRYQSNQLRTIRIAEHTVVKWHKLKRHYVMLELELKRPPTDAELSERSGLSIETIDICRTAAGIEPISFDASIAGTDLIVGDSQVCGTSQSAEEEYIDSIGDGTLTDHLMTMHDETRQMIVLYAGLDGRAPQTIHMIARRYRMPAAVVAERIKQAMKELKDIHEAS